MTNMDIDVQKIMDYLSKKLEHTQALLDDSDSFEEQLKFYGEIAIFRKMLTHITDFDNENEIRNYIGSLDDSKNIFSDTELTELNNSYCFLMNFVKGKFGAICEIYKFISTI